MQIVSVRLLLWLSTEISNCHFNSATFGLSWVRSLHSPAKNFFLFFDAIFLEVQHSERANGKRKKVQLKQFLCLDSQSIFRLSTSANNAQILTGERWAWANPKALSVSHSANPRSFLHSFLPAVFRYENTSKWRESFPFVLYRIIFEKLVKYCLKKHLCCLKLYFVTNFCLIALIQLSINSMVKLRFFARVS